MHLRIFQFILKTGAVALMCWLVTEEVSAAPGTNGIPIVVRKHRYSGRVELLTGQTETLPAVPVPSDENTPSDDKDLKPQEVLRSGPTTPPPPLMIRRADLKKNAEALRAARDPSVRTNAEPDLKNWGWLANEAEESRKALQAIKAERANEQGWTNEVAGATGTNHVETGSLKDYNFKPTLSENVKTATVERVVEDQAMHAAEKQKQAEARKAADKKENLDLAEQQHAPPTLTATNETLGLARTRKDEPPPVQDFQQTRAVMSEITSRYQPNYTLEEAARRPTATTTKTELEATATAQGKDRATWHGDEIRRPASLSDGSARALSTSTRTPTTSASTLTLPDTGRARGSFDAGPTIAPASSLIEPPRPPKPFEL
ncbi:MAG: hypothetical protein EPN23_00655 [Verrucomicrobia bacterium]|nr:MAG: hypothetical protein EPN23_00655 [Verrucomicrobiota bacterium]